MPNAELDLTCEIQKRHTLIRSSSDPFHSCPVQYADSFGGKNCTVVISETYAHAPKSLAASHHSPAGQPHYPVGDQHRHLSLFSSNAYPYL